MAITSYADADHVGCQDTRRSTSGSAQFIGDKLVSWSSKKQKNTAISTTKAEYIAMSGCLPLLFAATMSSTLGPSTLTYNTISFKSRKEKRSKGWSSYILYKMDDENVPAPAPTRSDYQILPFAAWVTIGKSNYVLDLQKKQKNPIFQISVDILQNTNFFSFELDEARFVLDATILREALEITPIDQAHQFVSPPSGEAIMDFVNELGYTETSGHDRPRYPVLRMLWGIITSSNVDYVELMWEEFVQAIQNFLTEKANLGSPTKKGKKDKAHVIPYCRFTKLIICHLGRTNNIYQRSTSLFHLTEEDLRLGNLKFIPKGEEDEHDQKVTAKKEGKKKSTSTKQSKPKPTIEKTSKPAPAPKPEVTKEKPSKPTTAKPPNPKPVKEKSTKATPLQKAGKGKVKKIRNVKSSFQLVDEPDEEPAHFEPEPEHQGEGEEFDMERIIQMSLESFQTQSQAHVGDAETGAGSNKTNNGGDTEILQITEELGEDVEKQVDLEEKTAELDQDQAGSDPGETHESRPSPEQVLIDEDQAGQDPGISHVALAGRDPEPAYDKFMATLYPKVQESLKFPVDEHVILEDPLSSTGTLSLMKNLEDAYAIGDQFINDKSTEDERGKLNVEA
ncbi:retrovirus-related pol polyprotein from transposon TNT 1-94 [Tanacetum coccineum]